MSYLVTAVLLLQNEVEYEDAVKLVSKGVKLVLEGANMPTTNDGINYLHSKGCVLAPAKACNAGGSRRMFRLGKC
jgi:glutamate dehydrogenase (NADP+)